MDNPSKSPLHLPRNANYSCVQCGKSCTMFLEVEIEPRSLEKLRSIDYPALLPEGLRDEDPWGPGPVDDARTVLKKKPGEMGCRFLQRDGLCAVHCKHGLEKKPQTCKDFPFRFTETPGGVYVGLSFACTAVLQNAGQPVEEQRGDLEAQFPVANSKRDALRTVRLTHRHEITWEAHLELEADLRALMADEGVPSIGDRLLMQSVYLDLVVKLLRETRADSMETRRPRTPREAGGEERFPPESGQHPDRAVVLAAREQFLAPDGRARLLRMARRARPSAALQRAFLGLVTAFRQNLYIKGFKPSRLRAVTGITRHYTAAMLRLGRVHLEALGEPFPYESFARFAGQWEQDAEQRALLQRFFDHCLHRKDLLLEDSVWLGQRFFLMHYALVRWHAVGLAQKADRSEIGLEDLREAISQVERHYGYHTDFGKLFEKLPTLGIVLDRIARKPSFGPSMVGEPV